MLNKKGESIVEVIVSLVLFILLFTVVASMVQTSLGIITKTYESNNELSESIANIESETKLNEVESINFKIEIWAEGLIRKEINIPVSVKQSGGIKIYAS